MSVLISRCTITEGTLIVTVGEEFITDVNNEQGAKEVSRLYFAVDVGIIFAESF